MSSEQKPTSDMLTCAGLFAGVGGIELGFQRAGIHTLTMCECLEEAIVVLQRRFPYAELLSDVRQLVQRKTYRLPDVDVVAAGFPCQDLSQCGRTAGIRGDQSSLINCVIDLLSRRKRSPRWFVVENVPFMLRLDRGRAMSHLTDSLEALGFKWAYRVVDARCFGLPQRRHRVILVASRNEDPREVLFADDACPTTISEKMDDRPRGFYWTEGNRGLGWAVDAVPTLKAGSTVGIPSPPAIWLPAFDQVITPTIEDVEAMQGFPRGWTSLAHVLPRLPKRLRWRLVGNAVPVPLAEWLGERLVSPGSMANHLSEIRIAKSKPWPSAAWGCAGQRWAVDASTWPICRRWCGLSTRYGSSGERFLDRPRLSARAARGFYNRIRRSSLKTDPRFVPSMRRYVASVEGLV